MIYNSQHQYPVWASILYRQVCSVPTAVVRGVCAYLQYGHFISQLALLLGGKAKLVDDFNCYVPPCLPVLS